MNVLTEIDQQLTESRVVVLSTNKSMGMIVG